MTRPRGPEVGSRTGNARHAGASASTDAVRALGARGRGEPPSCRRRLFFLNLSDTNAAVAEPNLSDRSLRHQRAGYSSRRGRRRGWWGPLGARWGRQLGGLLERGRGRRGEEGGGGGVLGRAGKEVAARAGARGRLAQRHPRRPAPGPAPCVPPARRQRWRGRRRRRS